MKLTKKHYTKIILCIIIILLIISIIILYHIPATKRAGLYNHYTGRRGFGLWKIFINNNQVRESQNVNLNLYENKIEIVYEASCNSFQNLTLKIVIDNKVIQQKTINCGIFEEENIIFLGDKTFNGKKIKILLESKINRNIFSRGLIKGMELNAYQTNKITIKE